MKSLKWLLVVMAVSLVPACGGAKTTVDYDREADFSKYKTYAYEKGTPVDNQLMDQRVVAALETQMKAEGFQKVASNPQVYATYHASTQGKTQFVTDTMGYGYGAGWGRRGMGGMATSTTRQVDYTVGTIVVGHLGRIYQEVGLERHRFEDGPGRSVEEHEDYQRGDGEDV